jgi:outer membrane protein OmpA-like peptidoglycan-associated protein
MLRSSIAIPLFLSTLAVPAVGDSSISHCSPAKWSSPRCEAERSRELAQALTHCKTPNSTTPRCLAERERQFAADRNAEANRSMAAVKAERARVLVLSLTHCKSVNSTTPRCVAEREARFAQARNAEINASLARVAQVRAFEQARNAEIDRSLAAVETERERAFVAARNAEVGASLAAYEAQRVLRVARARMAMFDRPLASPRLRASQLETGAIGRTSPSAPLAPRRSSRRMVYADPCGEAGQDIKPLRFSAASADIDDDMKLELDRLALIAHSCLGVRIKIHGYSDAYAPAQISRRLAVLRAQATRSYLIAVGIAANRISAMGHGMPRAADGGTDDRMASGYVEFSISDLTIDASATRIMWELAEVLDPTYIPPLARLSP